MIAHASPTTGSSSWADHLIYMEAGAELAVAQPGPASRASGLLLCAAVGIAAFAADRALAGTGLALDAAMLAMLAGVMVGNAGLPLAATRAGAKWIVRVVLPAGIALLGARLELGAVVALGGAGLALAAGVIALAALAVFAVSRVRAVPGRLGLLLAVGTGICGGSAIAAAAPVVRADEDEVAVGVATVALLGLVGMIALPPLGAALGMTPTQFGLWAGATIQQTPQVVAAGFAYGTEAGEVATLTKLVRISLLAPVVLALGLVVGRRRRGTRVRLAGLVPGFVLGFLALTAAASLGLLGQFTIATAAEGPLGAHALSLDLRAAAAGVSKVCLVLAMAAVGLETRWASLRTTGPAALIAAGGAALAVTLAAGAAVLLLA